MKNFKSHKNVIESFFKIKTFKSLKEVMEYFFNGKNFKGSKKVMESFFDIKGALSGLRQFLAAESALKMTFYFSCKPFYFMSKALFVLK